MESEPLWYRNILSTIDPYRTYDDEGKVTKTNESTENDNKDWAENG